MFICLRCFFRRLAETSRGTWEGLRWLFQDVKHHANDIYNIYNIIYICIYSYIYIYIIKHYIHALESLLQTVCLSGAATLHKFFHDCQQTCWFWLCAVVDLTHASGELEWAGRLACAD